SLERLKEHQIRGFFAASVQGLPAEIDLEPLLQLSNGNLSKLEAMFQAMAEEGMLQWSEKGWSWVMERAVPFQDLLPRHEVRWQQRAQQVRELLGLASTGLSLNNLAALLDVDEDALARKLGEWEAVGWIKAQLQQKSPRYFLSNSKRSSVKKSRWRGWSWSRGELQRLYDAGQFQSGAELAQLILAENPDHRNVPEDIAVWAARHLAAAGWAQKSLLLLSPPAPPESPTAGLSRDIRG